MKLHLHTILLVCAGIFLGLIIPIILVCAFQFAPLEWKGQMYADISTAVFFISPIVGGILGYKKSVRTVKFEGLFIGKSVLIFLFSLVALLATILLTRFVLYHYLTTCCALPLDSNL